MDDQKASTSSASGYTPKDKRVTKAARLSARLAARSVGNKSKKCLKLIHNATEVSNFRYWRNLRVRALKRSITRLAWDPKVWRKKLSDLNWIDWSISETDEILARMRGELRDIQAEKAALIQSWFAHPNP